MPTILPTLRQQLTEAEEHARLIEERIAEYVLTTDVPLYLRKEQRQTAARVREIQARIQALETDVCPYRGLAAFGVEHAAFYFGRDRATADLVRHVAQHPLTAVVGPSGSGKSSLVRAGLMYALQQSGDPWRMQLTTPGREPIAGLAVRLVAWLAPAATEGRRRQEIDDLLAYLRRDQAAVSLAPTLARIHEQHPDHRLLLVVDQFEEVYTQGIAPDRQQRFISLLLDAATGADWLRVVLALRADFYDRVLRDPHLGAAVTRSQFTVLPMHREELHAAIEQPALDTGRGFASGLVERMVEEVAQAPGNLPLLQFALTALWERQTAQGELTHAAYDEVGGVGQALAGYADQVLAGLSVPEQAQVPRILTQLVRPGEGTTDTRRVATREEVGEGQWALVTRLADARLVVTGRDATLGTETVEVVHEALITGWQPLRGWMNEERAFRTWQERLREGMRVWEDSGRDEGALLRGAPLAEAEGWLSEHAAHLSRAEREYIEASVAHRDAEEAAREQARRQRLRTAGLVIVALSVLLLIALGAVGFAFDRQQAAIAEADARATAEANAEDRAREAERQATIAFSRQLAAYSVSERETDLRLSLLLATQANAITSTFESRDSLLSGLQSSPHLSATLAGHTGGVNNVAFSPDGQTLASGSSDDTIILWNVATGQQQATLAGHTKGVNSVAYSPDGQTLASSSSDDTIRLWDVATGTQQAVLTGHTSDASSVAFSPDGQTLASGGCAQGDSIYNCNEGEIILWEVATGQQQATLAGHTRGVNSVAFSPDGQTLASVNFGSTIILWDVATGSQRATLGSGFSIPRFC